MENSIKEIQKTLNAINREKRDQATANALFFLFGYLRDDEKFLDAVASANQQIQQTFLLNGKH